jgi:hypothetical protein
MGRGIIWRSLVIVPAGAALTEICVVDSTMDRANAIAWLRSTRADNLVSLANSPELDRGDEIDRLRDAGGAMMITVRAATDGRGPGPML